MGAASAAEGSATGSSQMALGRGSSLPCRARTLSPPKWAPVGGAPTPGHTGRLKRKYSPQQTPPARPGCRHADTHSCPVCAHRRWACGPAGAPTSASSRGAPRPRGAQLRTTCTAHVSSWACLHLLLQPACLPARLSIPLSVTELLFSQECAKGICLLEMGPLNLCTWYGALLENLTDDAIA